MLAMATAEAVTQSSAWVHETCGYVQARLDDPSSRLGRSKPEVAAGWRRKQRAHGQGPRAEGIKSTLLPIQRVVQGSHAA